MKVSTGSRYARGGPGIPGPPPFVPFAGVLPDELVRAVRLNLEDVELRVQRVVRLRRPAELSTEDPVVDLHLLDVAEHGLPRRGAVTLHTRELDRGERDLRGAVARRAERPDGLPGVVLLPARDDRGVCRDAGDVRCEVRHVRARRLERTGVVRAVTAEHLRLLALLDQLLGERLSVARLLRRG